MKPLQFSPQPRISGVALVIVLAFIVLLTGVVVAYFSRTMTDRGLSNNSFSGNSADVLAQSAADIVIADLKREIADPTASTVTTVGTGSKLYFPKGSKYMLPIRSGNPGTPPFTATSPDPIPNLVRRSFRDDGPGGAKQIPAPGISSRASAVSSSPATANNVATKGQISFARWNKHYLIPQLNPNTSTDTTPRAEFTPPDWVFVTSDDGPKVIAAVDFPKVIGRYAYAIYDEGGLLDANVAGYPATALPAQAARKPALAYADLKQLGFSTSAVNDLVGWRNYASAQPGGVFGKFTFTTANQATNYYNSVINNTNGFLSVDNTTWQGSTGNDPDRTNQKFLSRQQLIEYGRKAAWGGSMSNLQYLTHFSRDLNQPSFAPDTTRPKVQTWASNPATATAGNDAYNKDTGVAPTNINPSFLQARVTTGFTRNDGAIANIGEVLIKKRFALNRLAWLTYQGPSALRANLSLLGSSRLAGDLNDDIWVVENTFGVTETFLKQGNAADIYKYFGLSWVSDTRVDVNNSAMDPLKSNKWVYNHQKTNPAFGATGSPITSFAGVIPSAIMTLSQVAAAGREPDFVELLKAAICAGSVGKAGSTGAAGTTGGYQNSKDTSVDTQVLQITANIIDQYDNDGVSTRILFDDGTWTPAQEFRGVEDLPYFYRVRSMNYQLRDSNPSVSYTPAAGTTGGKNGPDNTAGDPYLNSAKQLIDSGLAVQFQVPELWNPHSWNTAATGTGSGPRPTQFRIVAINGPPTISAPPAADPNKIAVLGYVRDGKIGAKNSTITPAVTVLPTNILHSLSYTHDSTALYFTIPFDATAVADPSRTRLDLFREPTALMRPGIPEGSKLHFGGDPAGAGTEGKNQVFNSSPETASSAGEAAIQSSIQINSYGFKGIKTANSSIHFDWPTGGTASNLKDDFIYLGIYMGSFPLRWVDGTWNIAANTTNFSGGNTLTYRLQYQDPTNSSNWITYDEKYSGLISQPGRILNTGTNKKPDYLTWKWGGNNSDSQTYSWADPRSARLGALFNNSQYVAAGDLMNQWSSTTPAGSQIAGAKQGATRGMRMDETVNPGYLKGYNAPTPNFPGYYLANTLDWRPGYLPQNNPNNGGGTTQYFADPDGVVRRGTSGYVPSTGSAPAMSQPASQASGIPLYVAMDYSAASLTKAATQIANEAPSRPIILNRPFYSVADLGYAYSDTPWRNLDFITPESGSASLLDVFCLMDTDNARAMAAGKVNLNTRQAPVLQAILANAYKDEFNINTTIAAAGSATAANATTISQALVKRVSDTALTLGSGSGPLRNVSELVGKWNSQVSAPLGGISGSGSYSGFSGAPTSVSPSTPNANPPNLSSILSGDTSSGAYYTSATTQRYRAATIRALANVGQTRVWNLMIDVIAQTGRFPFGLSETTPLVPDRFAVDGEQRYWVHVAVDRLTGEVIDKQIEIVKE